VGRSTWHLSVFHLDFICGDFTFFCFSMTAQSTEMSVELSCDHCGYDLRAHPQDGKCRECGMSVAESRRLAAIPRRPKWRDSDPRWRRRMLAGIWILVLLPLMEVLKTFGWVSSIPVPTIFNYRATIGTCALNDSLISFGDVYQSVVFCVGIVLLFSKERERRRSRMDWTRRWGVICSYVVLLLVAVPILLISALVLAGISALFLSMPPRYQPGMTQLFVEVSTTYLRHAPYAKEISVAVLVAFSSIAMVLACSPLFDALRSCGSKWAAAIILVPLPLFSLINLTHATLYCISPSIVTAEDAYRYAEYFWPHLLAQQIAFFAHRDFSGLAINVYLVETTKWCIMLTIAIWLSIAQFATWRRTRSVPAVVTPPGAGTA
jgi:hypothetical protein